MAIKTGSLLKQCTQFNIASAFITREGIDSLEIFLKENRTSNREGRLLIGLFQCFNRKADLEKLQKMANRNPRLQVNISCDF